MPHLSQLMIRAALFWLALGFTVGGLMLANKGVPFAPSLWALRAAHIHILLVGWMVQFGCGVAFWIMPRLDASGSRGNERLMWVCCVALNLGVALAGLPGLLGALGLPGPFWPVVLAAALDAVAAVAGVWHLWPRIVPFRRYSNEQKG